MTPRRPRHERPATPNGLCYAVGLCGFTWPCWLALAVIGPGGDDVSRALVWSWFVPLPYAAAWSALTVATPLQAALATGQLALIDAVLAASGFGVGLMSAGVLALPAFVGCGALFGACAARLQARIEPGADSGEWSSVHRRGGAAAGAWLAAAMLIGVVETPYWPSPLLRYAVLGAVLSAGFAWHARASWRKMREDELQRAAEPRERGRA